jgi:hypothetical protein
MVRNFSEGRAPVLVSKAGVEKWGFIDKNGEEVISSQYAEVSPFSEGVAVVTKSINGIHTYFVIDPAGVERPIVWE